MTGRRPYPKRVPLLLAAVGLLAGVGACGIQPDDRMTPLAADDLSDALRNTTTTSTTTTTTEPRPEETASTSEPPEAPETTTTTTEPAPLVPTQPTDVYYVYFGSNAIQRLPLNLPYDPVVVQHLVDALEQPPANLSAANLTTALVPGLVQGEVQVERGLATVALDEEVLGTMSSTQQPRAIAQIVLTLTDFRTGGPGRTIGQVRFTINGEPIAVFVPALGTTSAEPVAYEDFESLLIETDTDPTTTPPPTSAGPLDSVPQEPPGSADQPG